MVCPALTARDAILSYAANAFLTKGADSFSISECDLIISLTSKFTTFPGSTVHGPPTSSSIRAKNPAWHDSNNPTAVESAVYVHRFGLCVDATGHESLFKSSRMDVNTNSHSEIGCRNLAAPTAASGSAACPPEYPFGADARTDDAIPRPPADPIDSNSANRCTVYSLLPFKTYAFGHSGSDSTCTCTFNPNVIKPTNASGGSNANDLIMYSFAVFSSSS
mmetsp:Transcript_8647/g.15634  ORF Transcript_8647/g.15634 Transcript_8647/m.15634 type:complete len:220 (-) Transcript_8647:663-1322(-)